MLSSSPVIDFPLIDLAEVDRNVKPSRQFLEKLRYAIHEVGFFHLVGHGARGGDHLLTCARDFFDLPSADKGRLSMLNSPYFRGYSALGQELTRGLPDQRQQLDIGPECPPRIPGPDEPSHRWLAGPNQWPGSQPGLRTAVLDWMDQLTAIAGRVLRLILEALDTPTYFLDDVIEPDPHTHFKLLHYPGPSAGVTEEVGQGVGIHKDYGLVTLLLQDHHGGLQVAIDDRSFVDVPVIPGSLVVNLGELLEVATRGYLRATTHRVVRPPVGTDRYSAPFFYNPRLDAAMRPLPSPFVITAGGVVHDHNNPLFAGYGENVMKGMVRAFPDVIARHHPQLLTSQAPTC